MNNDDLISRQAAIDKINERQRKLIYCFGFENDVVKIMDIAKSIVIALPSAQSEAKPPKWVAEDRFVKNSFAEYPHCPQCNADVTTGQCYCMICGQHIDWSEDDG